MRRLKVGEPFHPGVTGFEEGIHYNYTPFGHTLTLSLREPFTAELEAVREGNAAFALIGADVADFVVARFGDRPWKVAAYNWWINPPAMRPDPASDLATLNGGLSMNLCLVNASNGLVQAIRTVHLSHEFGFLLLNRIDLQTRQAFNPWQYLEVVRETTATYQDGQCLVAEALCVCTADADVQHTLTVPTRAVVQ